MSEASTTDAHVLRPLDLAERYYWMADKLRPLNAVTIAELDRRLDPDELAAALEAVGRRQPLLHARVDVIDDQPAYVVARDVLPLAVTEARGTGWLAEVDAELDQSFDDGSRPFARCHYVPIADEDRSVVLLPIHHSLTDGRAGMRTLQHVLRWIDGGDATLPDASDVPPPLHEHLPPDISSASGALEVLRAVRAERQGQPTPDGFPFHDAGATRRASRIERLVIDRTGMDAVRARARAAGATLNGALASSVLEAVAELFDSADERYVYLATPTDLRERVVPPLPADSPGLAIGLLCSPYPVTPTAGGELARTISDQTRREVERGESHLFYRFSHVGGFAATDEGLAGFTKWMARAPQNVAVSNLGVVQQQGDPPWLHMMSCTLSPSPNQLAFVAAITYGEELVLNVVTDEAKLPRSISERLVQGISARTGARLVERS